MGVSAMALTYALEKVKKKYTPVRNKSTRNYVFWLAGTARNALVVLVGLIVAAVLGATAAGKDVFRLVGSVPAGLPQTENPLSGVDTAELPDIVRTSTVIALLGYLESVAIGKTFAQQNGYVLDATQELRAIGLGNVVSSMFQSFPITGSFSRTAVNSASNSQTPASGLFTGILVIFALMALTSTFAYIPKAALAAIIMMSVVHMIDIPHIKKIWRVKPSDMIVWATSFFLCLLWSLEFGIIAAIALSFILQEVDTSTQSLLRLEKDEYGIWDANDEYNTNGLAQDWGPNFVDGTIERGTVVVRVAGKLTFSMCNTLKERFSTIIANIRSGGQTTAIIIDCSNIPALDFTGTSAFMNILQEAQPAKRKVPLDKSYATVYRPYFGTILYVVNVPSGVHRVFLKAGMYQGSIIHGDWPLVKRDSIEAVRTQTLVLLCVAIFPKMSTMPLPAAACLATVAA